MLAGASAEADALSAKFADRAKAVLVKAGTLKAGATLPADVDAEGRAYSSSWAKLEKEDAEVEAEIRACDGKHGFPPLFPG
jgi:predicted phage gp36 major capsid-like protein